MRRLQKNLISTEQKTEQAICFLKKYEPVYGYLVLFSGGKDSIVTERLCKLAGVQYQLGYNRTGIDPPEIVSFVKRNYPNTIFFKPEHNFFELIVKKSPPLACSRWCCEEIKEKNGLDIKKLYPIHVVGIRAEEGRKRKKYGAIDIHQSINTVTIKPIFDWQLWHIWDFIKTHNLSYPSLYDEGFERLGCVVCPMMFHKNQKKLDLHRDRWPQIFRAFESAVMQWYEKKQFTDCLHGSFEKYMEAYYRGFEK